MGDGDSATSSSPQRRKPGPTQEASPCHRQWPANSPRDLSPGRRTPGQPRSRPPGTFRAAPLDQARLQVLGAWGLAVWGRPCCLRAHSAAGRAREVTARTRALEVTSHGGEWHPEETGGRVPGGAWADSTVRGLADRVTLGRALEGEKGQLLEGELGTAWRRPHSGHRGPGWGRTWHVSGTEGRSGGLGQGGWGGGQASTCPRACEPGHISERSRRFSGGREPPLWAGRGLRVGGEGAGAREAGPRCSRQKPRAG